MNRSNAILHSGTHVVQQVRPKLWQITFHFPAPTNCWLVEEDDGLTLVDAAHSWSASFILSAVNAVGLPLRRILITHAHPDHAGAASELREKTDATVLAHEADIPFLVGTRSMADEPGYWLSRFILSCGNKLGVLNSATISHVHPVSHGETVGSLNVLHTPGHTPGSISLWSADHEAIFCGDNLIYSLRILRKGLPWFTLDHARQNSSMRQYLKLPAKRLLSGHGPVFTGDVASAVKALL